MRLPLLDAGLHQQRGRQIAAKQVDETCGGITALDQFAALAGQLLFARRHEAARVLPDEQRGQHQQSGESSVQPVFAGERGDAGIDGHAQMGFVEHHSPTAAREP